MGCCPGENHDDQTTRSKAGGVFELLPWLLPPEQTSFAEPDCLADAGDDDPLPWVPVPALSGKKLEPKTEAKLGRFGLKTSGPRRRRGNPRCGEGATARTSTERNHCPEAGSVDPSGGIDTFGWAQSFWTYRRTFMPNLITPYENLVCRWMVGELEIPLYPTSAQFGLIRTIDWGEWDGVGERRKKVVHLPGWIDTHRGIRIYTLWRDSAGPPDFSQPSGQIGGGGPGTVDLDMSLPPDKIFGVEDAPQAVSMGQGLERMSLRQAQAVRQVKFAIELLLDSTWPFTGVGVTCPAHTSADRAVPEGNSWRRLEMPALTPANPGFPIQALASMLGVEGAVLSDAPLGIELRDSVWVDAEGNPAGLRTRGTNTQEHHLANMNVEAGGRWADGSETWATGGDLSENRVWLELRRIPTRFVLPEAWLGPPLPFTTPAMNRRTRGLLAWSNPGVAGVGGRSVIAGTGLVRLLAHELAHIALKDVGVGQGHGTHCGGTSIGRMVATPAIIPIDFPPGERSPSITSLMQPHWSTHWMCDHIGALLESAAYGLAWDDPLKWSWTLHIRRCARCHQFEFAAPGGGAAYSPVGIAGLTQTRAPTFYAEPLTRPATLLPLNGCDGIPRPSITSGGIQG